MLLFLLDSMVLKWNIICIFCSTPASYLKAFALTGRDYSNTRTQGVASLALGLVLLAFQAVPVQIRNLNFLLYFDFIAHAEVVIAPYGVHLTERAQSDAISLRY